MLFALFVLCQSELLMVLLCSEINIQNSWFPSLIFSWKRITSSVVTVMNIFEHIMDLVNVNRIKQLRVAENIKQNRILSARTKYYELAVLEYLSKDLSPRFRL